jgi:hypothetical protein
VIRFIQCRKKAPVPYLKKLAGTTGLDAINEKSLSQERFMVDSGATNPNLPPTKGDQYIYCIFEIEEKIAGLEKADAVGVWRTMVERRVDTIHNQIEMLDKHHNIKYEKYQKVRELCGKKAKGE